MKTTIDYDPQKLADSQTKLIVHTDQDLLNLLGGDVKKVEFVRKALKHPLKFETRSGEVVIKCIFDVSKIADWPIFTAIRFLNLLDVVNRNINIGASVFKLGDRQNPGDDAEVVEQYNQRLKQIDSIRKKHGYGSLLDCARIACGLTTQDS